MSINYTRAVWELNLKGRTKATQKLILLNLADRANENGICFPSIARIVEDTQLDRKTVISTISNLIEMGFIEDTKERKGVTKQVKVLKLKLDVSKLTTVSESNSTKLTNKQSQVYQETVPSLPRNSNEFGTRNLKGTNINLKKKEGNNFKKEKPKSMQECFEEGSDNKNADRSLTLSERLALMKGEKIGLNKRNEALEQCLSESGTNVPDNTKTVSMELTDSLNEMCSVDEEDGHLNTLSQQDYNDCDLAMLNALNHTTDHKQQEHLTGNKLTVGQLLGSLGSVYKSGVSEDRKKIYQMGQTQYKFSEDY